MRPVLKLLLTSDGTVLHGSQLTPMDLTETRTDCIQTSRHFSRRDVRTQ